MSEALASPTLQKFSIKMMVISERGEMKKVKENEKSMRNQMFT